MYEGGISVPAIAWGPGIKGGALKREFAHVTDVAPTIFELAGAKHPGTEYQGKPVLPLRGKSMVSWLKGKAPTVRGDHDAVGWELGGRKALRKGDWKIVHTPTSPGARTAGSSQPRQGPHRKPRPGRREPQKLGEMIVAWKQYVAETGTLEIEGWPTAPATATPASTTTTSPRPAASPQPGPAQP